LDLSLGYGGRRLLRPRRIAPAPRGLRLDLADRLFEGEPLARDLGLGQRRIVHPAQLRDQSRARALIEQATSFAGILFKTGDSLGNERIIIGHSLATFSRPTFAHDLIRKPLPIPDRGRGTCFSESCSRIHLKLQRDSVPVLCLPAPDWSTALPPDIPPIPRFGARILSPARATPPTTLRQRLHFSTLPRFRIPVLHGLERWR